MKLKFCIVLIMGLLFSTEMKCQEVAIKTNLLYDALMNVNAGVEVGLAPKWTLDVSGDYNGWKFSHQRQWKHWMVQPEARYWFCDRFQGWFLGVHAHGGQYNVGGGLDNSIDFLGTDLSPLGENRVHLPTAALLPRRGFSERRAPSSRAPCRRSTCYILSL